ncbi:MAG TPA: hypothetical protein VN031_03335 [Candidatus Microsaccharimonas sp.]|nr:hypothetical protein [Candidatus Microsaccharimonas sp.]
MSSVAVHETETPAEHTARELNSDFQFIADRLPAEVKAGYAGEVFTLCSTESAGILWGMYVGSRPNKTGEAIMEYVVRIGMLANTDSIQLELSKDFGLTYHTLRQPGPLRDLQQIQAEDLEHCPASLDSLGFALHSLREEFTRMHAEDLEHTEDIVHLDTFRVA